MITSANQLVPVVVIDEQGKSVSISDITDYVGLSQSLTGLVASGSLVGPLGISVFDKPLFAEPLIDLESDTESTSFLLPVDVNGKILEGNYTLTYTLRDEDLTTNFTLEVIVCYKSKSILDISSEYNCEGAYFKFIDSTNYNDLTVLTKSLVIKHPTGINNVRVAEDYVNTNLNQSSSIVVGSLWTGGYTTIFSVSGNYFVGTNLQIAFSRVATLNTVVQCQSSLISLSNCIAKVAEIYKSMCETGAPTRMIECDLMLLNTYINLYEVAISQGSQNPQANTYSLLIRGIVDKYGCGCGQDNSIPEFIGEATGVNAQVVTRGFNSLIQYDNNPSAQIQANSYSFSFDAALLKDKDLVEARMYFINSTDDQEIIVSKDATSVSVFLPNPSKNEVVLYILKASETVIRVYLQERENGITSQAFFSVNPALETEIITINIESAEPFSVSEGVFDFIAEYKIK